MTRLRNCSGTGSGSSAACRRRGAGRPRSCSRRAAAFRRREWQGHLHHGPEESYRPDSEVTAGLATLEERRPRTSRSSAPTRPRGGRPRSGPRDLGGVQARSRKRAGPVPALRGRPERPQPRRPEGRRRAGEAGRRRPAPGGRRLPGGPPVTPLSGHRRVLLVAALGAAALLMLAGSWMVGSRPAGAAPASRRFGVCLASRPSTALPQPCARAQTLACQGGPHRARARAGPVRLPPALRVVESAAGSPIRSSTRSRESSPRSASHPLPTPRPGVEGPQRRAEGSGSDSPRASSPAPAWSPPRTSPGRRSSPLPRGLEAVLLLSVPALQLEASKASHANPDPWGGRRRVRGHGGHRVPPPGRPPSISRPRAQMLEAVHGGGRGDAVLGVVLAHLALTTSAGEFLRSRVWTPYRSARASQALIGSPPCTRGLRDRTLLPGPVSFGRLTLWVALGFALGVVALAACSWAIFRLGRRLPVKAFLTAAVALIMATSVAFLGNAVAALQEVDVLQYHRLADWPRLPIFLAEATGYRPTLETVLAQALLTAVYVLGALVLLVVLPARRRRRDEGARRRRPPAPHPRGPAPRRRSRPPAAEPPRGRPPTARRVALLPGGRRRSSLHSLMAFREAVDVGGTFTKAVAFDTAAGTGAPAPWCPPPTTTPTGWRPGRRGHSRGGRARGPRRGRSGHALHHPGGQRAARGRRRDGGRDRARHPGGAAQGHEAHPSRRRPARAGPQPRHGPGGDRRDGRARHHRRVGRGRTGQGARSGGRVRRRGVLARRRPAGADRRRPRGRGRAARLHLQRADGRLRPRAAHRHHAPQASSSPIPCAPPRWWGGGGPRRRRRTGDGDARRRGATDLAASRPTPPHPLLRTPARSPAAGATRAGRRRGRRGRHFANGRGALGAPGAELREGPAATSALRRSTVGSSVAAAPMLRVRRRKVSAGAAAPTRRSALLVLREGARRPRAPRRWGLPGPGDPAD